MTINTNPARNEYTATAGQTIFNYTFKIYASTDLTVYVTPSGVEYNDSLYEVTGFSVSGVGAENGGSITLVTPASLGDRVTIVSNISSNRTTNYQDNGDFIPDTVNNDFDRTVSITKQSEDLLNRTLVSQRSAQNASPLSLPVPDSGKYLRWNSAESGLENVSGFVPSTAQTIGTGVGDLVQLVDVGSGNPGWPDFRQGQDIRLNTYGLNLNTGGTTVTNSEIGYLSGSTAGGYATAAAEFADEARQALTTTGDIPYASAANVIARLAIGSADQKLFTNAAGTLPEWDTGCNFGTFTRARDAATGTQAITGVGFKPSCVVFLANVASTSQTSIGFSNQTSNYSIYDANPVSAGTWSNASTACVFMLVAVGQVQEAAVSSFDSDGFTLSWTKTGSPPAGTITGYYLALR